ncbi:hypothetical protein KDH_06800 [Dictyobacter sp. S3.2.2.5]|uniref:Inner membrane protein YgaP-like transmembrane domain-containing protein n=1 Tax=Dictyobacter halimunensis TaxID=3026934 RepID=A0ABQ6FI80_9CHLR|nr:hypothetical protein KDH_06800 [Dictyobacter sp. S3.2.2.5]
MASIQSPRKVRLTTVNNLDQITSSSTNIGKTERWISAISGGALASYGIVRRDWLGAGLAVIGGGLLLRGANGRSVLYKALNINTGGQQLSANVTTIPGNKGIRVSRSRTINKSAQDLYAFWHNFEMAPLYMPGIKVVNATGERTTHWVASGGNEWNAELLADKSGQLIAWHAHGKPTTANAGKVIFQPAGEGRGTVVTLELDFFQADPLHKIVSHFTSFGAEYEVAEILRRFKDLMEAGEIPTIKGQPTGQGRK